MGFHGKIIGIETLESGSIPMVKPIPSQEHLHARLIYEPDTGLLFWKERPASGFPAKTPGRSKSLCDLWNSRYANKPAFTFIRGGYHVGCFDKENYFAHRIIWKMETGEEPEAVDHIDGVRTNNRFANLRAATILENARNRAIPSNNTSGVMGVYFWTDGKTSYWAALVAPRKTVYCKTFEEAVAARMAAEEAMGFHENHGRLPAAQHPSIS